jgi:hypothetical protein
MGCAKRISLPTHQAKPIVATREEAQVKDHLYDGGIRTHGLTVESNTTGPRYS